jgi:hypothetical protein
MHKFAIDNGPGRRSDAIKLLRLAPKKSVLPMAGAFELLKFGRRATIRNYRLREIEPPIEAGFHHILAFANIVMPRCGMMPKGWRESRDSV